MPAPSDYDKLDPRLGAGAPPPPSSSVPLPPAMGSPMGAPPPDTVASMSQPPAPTEDLGSTPMPPTPPPPMPTRSYHPMAAAPVVQPPVIDLPAPEATGFFESLPGQVAPANPSAALSPLASAPAGGSSMGGGLGGPFKRPEDELIRAIMAGMGSRG